MFKLEERHRFFKKLQGDEKFAKTVESWTPLFVEHAKKTGETEVLPVTLSMGKLLADGGHDPNEMFAVAVELVNRNFSLNDEH